MSFFPPIPVYPRATDSNRTLFLVYDTAESVLSADNPAWSDEIHITSQLPSCNPIATPCEVWASNGYANLDGELLYYDAVDTDSSGRVVTLKRCLRNLGGEPTHFNSTGTSIRGFVIAEHHQQIVQAILLIENFIGINFSLDQTTLDWRIRNLFAEPIIFDDFSCPDVTLNFNILQDDPTQGIVANYAIQTAGQVGSLLIQFGDGQTSTQPSGQHNYAANASVDPVVNVTNGDCQITQSTVTSSNISQPSPRTPVPPFFVPVPILPDFPSFTFPSVPIPSTDMFIPPIIFPMMSTVANVPSQINFNPPHPVPNQINFGPARVPSIINFGPNNVPTEIKVTGIPSSITLPIPSKISIIGPSCCLPSIISLIVPCLSICKPPILSVDWGPPPVVSVSCVCRIVCPSSSPVTSFGAAPFGMTAGLTNDDIQVEYDTVGFPSEIKVVAPYMEPIKVVHEIPKTIALTAPDMKDIRIHGPDLPIPSEIRLVVDRESVQQVISFSLPESIRLDTSGLPTSIRLEVPNDLPKISFDRTSMPDSIKVVGIPDVISVVGMPTVIDVRVPDKIPLVFEGPPLSAEIKIKLDVQKLVGEQGVGECVMIVPCLK